MKYFLFKSIILIIIVSGSFVNVYAQNKVIVKGIMLDEASNDAVPLANILNRNNGARFISNRKGYFKISISPDDSVTITSIGYASKLLMGKEIIPFNLGDTIRIYLRPVVYKLKAVNVVYANRKRDSIARLVAEFLKTDPLMNNYDRIINRPRGSMQSPLTAMYEEWSKEGNDMQKFEDFLRYAEQQKAIDRRFNKQIVKKVTGIEEPELDKFMMECKLDRYFIITAPDYDLYEAIKKRGEEFKSNGVKERSRLR